MRLPITDAMEDIMLKRSDLTRSMLVAALLAVLATSAAAQSPSTQPAAKDPTVIQATFARFDTNGDGKLSKEELAMLPALSSKFAELDKDKDGFLSLAEFTAGYLAMS
jgi:Ca2+-binding EF-hand superfamily protein